MNDNVENGADSKYYSPVKNLMNNLGMDLTDIYIRLKIFVITKQVTTAREGIFKIREAINKQKNSDEIRHLEYELEEGKDSLNNLLEELKDAYDMYEYYKESIISAKI